MTAYCPHYDGRCPLHAAPQFLTGARRRRAPCSGPRLRCAWPRWSHPRRMVLAALPRASTTPHERPRRSLRVEVTELVGAARACVAALQTEGMAGTTARELVATFAEL